jgi:O-antigen/teichoic acid export membrane protein
MTLIEILLIVPSALGNSMLHKVSSKSLEEQKSSFGNLLVLVCSIGMVIAANFVLFHTEIIRLVSGPKYLTSTLGQIGSDYILIFLGFVLLMTFIKQVYNYIFVATDNQNELFKINSLGVILGIGCGIFLVKYYGLVG